MNEYDRGASMALTLLLLALAIATLIVAFWIGQGTQAQSNMSTLFQSCVEKHHSTPVNVVWYSNTLPWIQSTVHPDAIDAVLALIGEPLEWDSETGVAYPADLEPYGIKTIGITLADGTLVRFIADGIYGGRYYGWLTDSTQFYTASYNDTYQPHVRCGFWSMSVKDVEDMSTMLWALSRFDEFNYEAR